MYDLKVLIPVVRAELAELSRLTGEPLRQLTDSEILEALRKSQVPDAVPEIPVRKSRPRPPTGQPVVKPTETARLDQIGHQAWSDRTPPLVTNNAVGYINGEQPAELDHITPVLNSVAKDSAGHAWLSGRFVHRPIFHGWSSYEAGLENNPPGHTVAGISLVMADPQGNVTIHHARPRRHVWDNEEAYNSILPGSGPASRDQYHHNKKQAEDRLIALHKHATSHGRHYAEYRFNSDPTFRGLVEAALHASEKASYDPDKTDHVPGLILADWLEERGFNADRLREHPVIGDGRGIVRLFHDIDKQSRPPEGPVRKARPSSAVTDQEIGPPPQSGQAQQDVSETVPVSPPDPGRARGPYEKLDPKAIDPMLGWFQQRTINKFLQNIPKEEEASSVLEDRHPDSLVTSAPVTPKPSPDSAAPTPQQTNKLRFQATDQLMTHLARHPNIPVRLKSIYFRAAKSIFGRMPHTAMSRFVAHTKEYKFYSDLEGLNEGLGNDFPGVGEFVKKRGAVFFGGQTLSGKLYLDGGHDKEDYRAYSKKLDPLPYKTEQCYAHEFTHAVDGPRRKLSGSPEWEALHVDEFENGELTSYGSQNPVESFAEFGRLLYGHLEIPLRTVELHFPRASAFFRKQGLWPER